MSSTHKNVPQISEATAPDQEGGTKEVELTQQKLNVWSDTANAGENIAMSAEARQTLIEDSTPMKLTELFVDRPCAMLCGAYCCLLVLAVIAFAANFFAVETESGREWLVWEDPITRDFEKWTLAETYIGKNTGSETLPVRSERNGAALFIYQNDNGDGGRGLLNKDYFQKIENFESDLQKTKGWKEVCLANATTIDNPPCSVYSYFSPFKEVNEYIRQDNGLAANKGVDTLTTAQFEASFKKLMAMGATKEQAKWAQVRGFFDKYISAKNFRIKYAQSFLQPALPLKLGDRRYKNLTDGEKEQADRIKAWAKDVKKAAKDNSVDGGYKISLWATVLLFDEIAEILNQDFAFAIFSVTFVYFYLSFHLRSCWLAAVGVSLILLSFPFTVVVTEGILQITYFGNLQIVAIYIVLGIAADDIFVFYDAWRQSKNLAPEIMDTKHKRMAYAWRRAVRAMAVTSLTTAVAFFANALSPLMPIKAFGVFSGVIVPINYFLVVMMMPPAAIIYEKWKFHKCCCCPCGFRSKEEVEELERPEVGQLGAIEKVFDQKVNACVARLKWLILVLTIAWFAVAAVFALKVGPMTKQEDPLDPDHPVMKPIKILSDEFGVKESSGLGVSVYWGVSGVNTENDDVWSPKWDTNTPIFDSNLNAAPTENQKFLKSLCGLLRAQPFTLPKGVRCWIEDFEKWIKEKRPTVDGTQLNSFPVPEDKFADAFKAYLTTSKGYQQLVAKDVGFVRNKLIYFKFEFKSGLDENAPSETVKKPEFEKWKKFIDDQKALAPKGVDNFAQTTRAWPWIVTEEAFVSNARNGILISIAFAFVILLVATRNLLQSVLAIFAVVTVVISVVAVMHWNDMQLGVSESIGIVILIGFSVDYIVHFSHAYMHSPAASRYNKMRQSYREMGVSILSGCLTTFGCGAFLYGGQFVFFQKFAFILTITVVIALVVAVFSFGALVHIAGPERGFCDLNCFKKKKTDAEVNF